MRKMTKTAVTLAAMSAMTVASASLASAAVPQDPNISSVAKQEEAVTSSAVGEWSGDDVNGWSFTKEGDIKLKNTWAQIDGVWYYFDGDKIARNRFLTLDDKGYFFDETGRLATGWQKITSKMDAYSDIDISNKLYDPTNNYYVPVDPIYEYDYQDYVWCYFDEHGVAKHNQWFQDSTGFWYYFDGDVMVKNVYNYVVNPDNYDAADSSNNVYYGFDENGIMLRGWNYKKVTKDWNNPTAGSDGQIWYYYNDNGQMQKAGWRQLDGKWYLFANEDADNRAYWGDDVTGVGSRDDKWCLGGYPLIVNSYVASYPNKTASKPEYFYVNSKGEMVTGVNTVPKNTYKVMFYHENKDIQVSYEQIKTSTAIDVNFGSKGAATEAVVNNRFYTLEAGNIYAAKFGKGSPEVWKVENSIYNAESAFKTKAAWTFTDQGDAVQSTIATSGYYFDTVTFQPVAEDIAKNNIKTGTTPANRYIILPDTQTAKDALKRAQDAYTDERAKQTARNSAKNAWLNAVNNEVVAVSGYNGSADFNGTYRNLVALRDSKQSAYLQCGLLYDAALELNAPTAVLDKLKKDYDAAHEEYDYYKNACAAVESTAAVQAIINDNAATYNAYLRAVSEYNAALDEYREASKAVLILNYNYFANKWDTGMTSLSTNFAVVGELVKNAFIARSDDVLYLADENGNLLTNKAVIIDTSADLHVRTTNNTTETYQNAYILFGADGKAICGYEGTRKSVTIGGITYWSSGRTTVVGKADEVTIFVSNRALDATDDGINNPRK